jgi:TRAP transporter 4TM/12TM fusion protein
MSDADKIPEGLSDEDSRKLKELMAKDAKAERQLRGPWAWFASALGAALVLIYFYGAGVDVLGTQYHLGIYVLITFILVFLVYPAGSRAATIGLGILCGALLTVTLSSFLVFESPEAFYIQARQFTDAWGYDGLLTALKGDLGPLVYSLAMFPFLAAAMVILDLWVTRRFPHSPSACDVVFLVISAGTVLYWISQFAALNYRAGAEHELDMLVSMIGLTLALEVCRRVLGWSITLIGVGMICFGLFGPYLPDILAHRGFRFERLATALFLTTNGVFGVMANVLATYVILFIFFGAFLQKSGAGRFFIDLPLALAGKSTGGPAKVAVISSALFGSVSGSAIANTVSTGSFTIPLMKRAGFRPHVAGGFLMAELTGTPYATIMILSIGPALLYFLSVFSMIHFEARKLGLGGVDLRDQVPEWRIVLKSGWYYSLPLVIITVMMLMGRSPGNAAFWGTLSCIAVSWVKAETRMGLRQIWEAIQSGARGTLIVGATVGVIGVIVGTISLTGMGLKFSDLIISMAGGSLLMAILLIALASLVLGMGVPVTASYLIVAVLAVPALGEFGVAAIAAHMIVYWLSQDSNITPPVCVAAYAGAAIAGSDPWKTGWTSFKFAKLLYVMPLLFAYVPAILLDGTPMEIFTAFVSATLGTIAFGAVSMGYFRRGTRIHEWLLLAAGTLLLYWPSFLTDAFGLGLFALVWWMQRDAQLLAKPASAAAASNPK